MKQRTVPFSIIFSLLFFFTICSMQVLGQYTSTSKVGPIKADSLTSGNYKDVFKSFFQLAFNRITSSNKEVQFTSNPFAVMAKADTSLLVDTNYYKYRALRKLNFTFSARLDSSYKFNGFSSEIKYAIINKRDITVSRAFISEAYIATGNFHDLTKGMKDFASSIGDRDLQNKFALEIDDFFDGKKTFNKLDTSVQRIIKDFAKAHDENFLKILNADSKLNFHDEAIKSITEVENEYQEKPLWTAGISDTTYKDQFLFKDIVLSSEFLWGIIPSKNSLLELDIKAYNHFADDTTKSSRDLKRSLFTFEPGLNFSLKNKNNGYSWAELKLSYSYNRVANGLYSGEKKDSSTFNGTLRIRIIDDIWIPLEIKYDPKNGNVFGFLNVRANFTGLRKLLKGSGA